MPESPRDRETPDLGALVDSFADIDGRETTALLTAFSALAEGEVALAARDAAAQRHDHMPIWLATMDEVRAVGVSIMQDVLDDGADYFVELRWPNGAALTAVAYIDTNLGWVVKDGFAIPEPRAAVLRDYRRLVRREGRDTYTSFVEFDAADARARIDAAIRLGRLMMPPFETDSWPMARPLVEWAIRKLPIGGSGFAATEWDDLARASMGRSFRASPFAAAVRDASFHTAIDSVLWYGCDYSGCDPLRWSPVRVELFLADWVIRKVVAPVEELRLVPDVLAAFVRYAHDARDIPERLTAETLQAVEYWEPDFLEAIERPRAFGAEALARVAAGVSPFFDEDDDRDDVDRWYLERQVGGRRALETLDAEPLTDEPFDWSGVTDDIRSVVEETLLLADGCCEALFDSEFRTICRRVLARAASRSSQVFRRKARTDIGAAALVWLVGNANHRFDGQVRVSDVCEHLSVKSGSLSDRANTLRKAAGICEDEYHQSSWDTRFADPTLLHSAYRARLLAERDALDD
jgi:hypothetical protein